MSNNTKFAIGEWVQLAKMGEHPHKKSGKVQVLDEIAIETICNNFTPELLLDFEHKSRRDGGTTVAAGWIEELLGVTTGEDAGLWLKVRWSEDGEKAVGGGNLRYISGTFDYEVIGGNRVRLTCLLDAGLTNRPNIRGCKPISNCESGEETQETTTVSAKIKVTKEQNKMSKALINSALGLDNEASENATLDKIEALKKKIAKLEEELATAKASLENSQTITAERDTKVTALEKELETIREEGDKALINAAGITDEAKVSQWLKTFKADRENGKALLNDYSEALKKSEKALTNGKTAKTPGEKSLENSGGGNGKGGEEKFSRDDAAALMNSQIVEGDEKGGE